MGSPELDPKKFDDFLLAALREDIGPGDVTCEAVLPPAVRGEGALVCKQEGVVAGLPLARRVFELLDPEVRVESHVEDGSLVREGQRLITVTGKARTILQGERTALNLLQHLSGIATFTRQFVERLKGTKANVYDTRKTLPGMRVLQKYAVAVGGGKNHRMGLHDMILLKENHFAAADDGSGASYREVVRRAIENAPPGVRVQAEARTLDEALQALQAGADLIMLDNLKPPQLASAVRAIRDAPGGSRVQLEASGGVRLETVRAFAEAGVDRISVGGLTHSVPALDIALYFRRL
ncbi:MAG: carboxylating nicotinate-nucleotide diphosphorylase [Planctomycetota bacterium]